MSDVWVLLGHFKHKPSELLGVFEHYERGSEAMQGLGFIGVHNEVELKRVIVNREKNYTRKKVKK